MLNIGKGIQIIRKRKGMTQRQLAEKIGIPANSLSRYEIGMHEPNYDMTLRIAEALEVAPIEFIKATEENETEKSSKEAVPSPDFTEPQPLERVAAAMQQLNPTGKRIAAERVEELTKIEEYTKPEEP